MKQLTAPRMERCIGCHSCSLACARLVHKQVSWDTAGIRISSSGGLSTGFVAALCLACDPAPCAEACPTGAYSQRKGGGVLVNAKLCIRCGHCAEACPTGAYSQRKGGGVLVNAKLCIRCGHCAEACPVGAIHLDHETRPYVCLHCGRCVEYCPHDCLELRDLADLQSNVLDGVVPGEEA